MGTDRKEGAIVRLWLWFKALLEREFLWFVIWQSLDRPEACPQFGLDGMQAWSGWHDHAWSLGAITFTEKLMFQVCTCVCMYIHVHVPPSSPEPLARAPSLMGWAILFTPACITPGAPSCQAWDRVGFSSCSSLVCVLGFIHLFLFAEHCEQ